MKKYWFIFIGVFILFLQGQGFAYSDNTCVTAIDLPGACSDLDYSDNLMDNPYFYKNLNTICGLTINLPGLPSFNFLNGHLNIPDLQYCSLLRGVVQGSSLDVLKNILPSFVVNPPKII